MTARLAILPGRISRGLNDARQEACNDAITKALMSLDGARSDVEALLFDVEDENNVADALVALEAVRDAVRRIRS